MPLERPLHLALARLRVARQQCLRGHDHPAAAITALAGLFADERTLQHTRLSRSAQALDRRDPALTGGADGKHARALFNPIHQHAARAALRLAAAEFRAVQVEVIAENVEQRRIGRSLYGMRRTVDPECEYRRHGASPLQGTDAFPPRVTDAIVCTITAIRSIRNAFSRRINTAGSGYSQIRILLGQQGTKIVGL